MNPASSKPDPLVGQTILDGQFKITQLVGRGGMGSVYRALQPSMNRMVAIKLLHADMAQREDVAARFRREARAMSQLTHPNTTKVFLVGQLDDGSVCLAMELLEGKTIGQVLRETGPFSYPR